MKPRLRTYHGDMLPVTIHVAKGFKGIASLQSALARRCIISFGDLKDPGSNESATCYLLGSHPAALVSFWCDGADLDASLMAHEAVHAAMSFCEDLGITTTSKNDETLAYLVQWIVGKMSIT